MKKKKRIRRAELVRQVIKLIGLPESKKTPTFFTKSQLLEMVARLKGDALHSKGDSECHKVLNQGSIRK